MSQASPRKLSVDFKVGSRLQVRAREMGAGLSRGAEVASQLIYQWRKADQAYVAAGFNRKRGRRLGWDVPPPSLAVLTGLLGRRPGDCRKRGRFCP